MKVFPEEHWPCWTWGKQKRKKSPYETEYRIKLHGTILITSSWNNQYLNNFSWVLRILSGKHKIVHMLQEESLTSVSIKYSNYSRMKRSACVSSFTLQLFKQIPYSWMKVICHSNQAYSWALKYNSFSKYFSKSSRKKIGYLTFWWWN